MLIYTHDITDQERCIIFHRKIYYILKRIELYQCLIIVIRPIHCIVKTQGPAPVLLAAEDKDAIFQQTIPKDRRRIKSRSSILIWKIRQS